MTEPNLDATETKGKHTPGPWLVENEGDGTWTVWTRQPHIGSLAHVQDEDINGLFPAEANARLMAAAPDMLSVLKAVEWNGPYVGYAAAVCPSCDAYRSDNKGHRKDCELAAAIAKAEGRKS